MKANLPIPGFCKYICPAGIFEGALFLLSNEANNGLFALLNVIFTWKFILLVLFFVACVFMYRFFCRFICPLGAIYSLFNKFNILGVKVNKDSCIDCGLCVKECKMDIRKVGDHECINCGECIPVCPTNAIYFNGNKFKLNTFMANTIRETLMLGDQFIAILSYKKDNNSAYVSLDEKKCVILHDY